jgi:hypothetical protein
MAKPNATYRPIQSLPPRARTESYAIILGAAPIVPLFCHWPAIFGFRAFFLLDSCAVVIKELVTQTKADCTESPSHRGTCSGFFQTTPQKKFEQRFVQFVAIYGEIPSRLVANGEMGQRAPSPDDSSSVCNRVILITCRSKPFEPILDLPATGNQSILDIHHEKQRVG